MVSIVNGYFCATGCDERLAKKNIDPRNPHNDPVKQEQLDANDPAKVREKEIEEAEEARLDPKRNPAEDRGEAVVFGGSLASVAVRSDSQSDASGASVSAAISSRSGQPGSDAGQSNSESEDRLEPGSLVDVYA